MKLTLPIGYKDYRYATLLFSKSYWAPQEVRAWLAKYEITEAIQESEHFYRIEFEKPHVGQKIELVRIDEGLYALLVREKGEV